MDFINSLMNIAIPPMFLTLLLFFLPPYFFFKYLFCSLGPFFSDDMKGKVVLITGASSGIGEKMAYVYTRKGARLALVARRGNRLHSVASIATLLGCKDVVTIQADVSRAEDCERLVSETINYYGQPDHLVNNAGVAPVCMFEESPDISKFKQAMDINFWGSVYTTHFAIPYLKRSRRRIIAISSAASWLPVPRLGIYGVVMSMTPVMPVKETAKAIVEGACQGAYYLTVPAWIKPTFLWHLFFPEVLEWCNRLLLMPGPGSTERETASVKIVEALARARHYPRPGSVDSPQLSHEYDRDYPYS